MEKLNNVIPRKIVLREFLIALAITQIRLATELRISANRAAEI